MNIEKIPFQRWSHGNKYEADIAWAGNTLHSRQLGFNVTSLPSGKSAFPFHMHHANEEMFYILEGKGSIRIGDEHHPIRRGDFISLPAGRQNAHQITNDSKAPLRYIAVSTMRVPEVAEYPDSGKLGVFTGTGPGQEAGAGDLRHFAMLADGVDYWQGE